MGVKLLRPRIGVIKPRVTVSLPTPPQGEPGNRWGSGRGGRPWRRKRDRVMRRDGKLCQTCKREGRLTLATEVDHILAVSQGGTDDDANLEAICGPHHLEKTQAEAAQARRKV